MATFKSSLKLTQQTPIGKEELKKINQMITSLIGNSDSFEFRVPVDWKTLGLLDYPNVVKYPMDLGTVKENVKNSTYQHVEECLDDIQLIWDNCKSYNAEGSWIFKLSDKLEKYFKNMVKNYLPAIQFSSQVVKKDKLTSMKRESDKDTEKTPAQTSTTSNSSGSQRQGAQQNGSSTKEQQQSQQQQQQSQSYGSTNGNSQIFQEEDPSDVITTQDKILFSQKVKMLPTEQLGMIVLMIQNSASQAFKEVEKDKCQILVNQIDPDTFKKINQQIELWNVITDTVQKKVHC